MNMDQHQRTIGLFLLCFGFFVPSLHAKPKRWVLTLPVVAVARESTLEVDLNLGNDTSLAFSWARTALGEELREKELQLDPDSSLSTSGQEFMALFQRFSNGNELSGFHWGLGAGYKTLSAKWKRISEQDRSMGLDGSGFEQYDSSRFTIAGPTFTGRVGYRYVASKLGFTVGTYLKLRHFNSKIDQEKVSDAMAETGINKHDQIWMKRRLMTSLLPALELGWAF